MLEVAFEGLQRSSRHKSGVAMRFPRINRLRWDKPPREADRLETLERMLKGMAVSDRSGCRLTLAKHSRKYGRPGRRAAIDANRRVPHLPCSVLEWAR